MSHHAAGLPFLMWIARGITEDAVALGLVELTTLLITAALGVLTLIAVLFGGEDALSMEQMLATLSTIEFFDRTL